MISRDQRQQQVVNKWIDTNYIAGFEGVTGFGKTQVSLMAVKQCNAKSITVIVPTRDLRDQWVRELKSFKVKNATVYVVNTAYKLKIVTDLLILDEVHTTGAAEQFSLCWKNAKYDKLLWLTATFDRKDGLHKELLRIAPKIDSVTFEEALRNNWVSDYHIYNIRLEFTDKERHSHYRIKKQLQEVYEKVAKELEYSYDYVEKNMWNIKFDIERNHKHLYQEALKYQRLIAARKKLLYNAQEKKDLTIWLLKESKLNKKQTIIFSQTRDFADYIHEHTKEDSILMHSGMTNKARIASFKRFRDGRTKKRIISSVKALNEGIDVPQLEFGIVASGTSSKKDSIQQLGRILRLNGDKKAIMVNLYIKDTQDAIWLRNRQYGLFRGKISWLNDPRKT